MNKCSILYSVFLYIGQKVAIVIISVERIQPIKLLVGHQSIVVVTPKWRIEYMVVSMVAQFSLLLAKFKSESTVTCFCASL